ncbi:MAG TPA: hypothetical protein VEH28_04705 [Thermoplasmata archaeon]|nr:hypothetical protein [Thermoplasmata archaeon]
MLSPESALIVSRQRNTATLETLRRYAQLERVGLIDLQATVLGPSGTGRRPPSVPARRYVDDRGTHDSAISSGSRPSTP